MSDINENIKKSMESYVKSNPMLDDLELEQYFGPDYISIKNTMNEYSKEIFMVGVETVKYFVGKSFLKLFNNLYNMVRNGKISEDEYIKITDTMLGSIDMTREDVEGWEKVM